VIVVDTSVLIDSLCGRRQSLPALEDAFDRSLRLVLPTLVLYEWLRGPRSEGDLALQEALFPSAAAIEFGLEEARIAANLYRRVPRPRGREIDLAIAACAIARDGSVWTLNPGDFEDIPGVSLYIG
jgi:predicted nucleic acid-binding protein